MNKSSLADSMAMRCDLTKKECKRALDAMLGAITKTLSEGDQVQITGFGTLLLSYHPAKNGRNPQTGEVIEIEGANKVAFKPAKALKDAIQR